MAEEEKQLSELSHRDILTTYSTAYSNYLLNKAQALDAQANQKIRTPREIASCLSSFTLGFAMYRHFVRFQGYRLLGFTLTPLSWSAMSASIVFMGWFGYNIGNDFYNSKVLGKLYVETAEREVSDAFKRQQGFAELSKIFQSGAIQEEWKQGLLK